METDYQLIDKIKNNQDSNALVEFCKRHKGIIVKELNKVCSATGISIESIISDEYIIVYNTAKSYDDSFKTKPSTWLSNIARFHALNTINYFNKHSVASGASFEELVKIVDSKENDSSFETLQNFDTIDRIMELAAKDSDKRVEQIIRIRFLNKERRLLSFKETGRLIQPPLTPQGTKLVLDRFLDKIKTELIKENL